MRLGSRSGHMLNLKQGKHLDTQKRRLRLLKHASEVLNSNQYNIKHLRRYHKMGHLNLGCLTPIRGFFFFLAHSEWSCQSPFPMLAAEWFLFLRVTNAGRKCFLDFNCISSADLLPRVATLVLEPQAKRGQHLQWDLSRPQVRKENCR